MQKKLILDKTGTLTEGSFSDVQYRSLLEGEGFR